MDWYVYKRKLFHSISLMYIFFFFFLILKHYHLSVFLAFPVIYIHMVNELAEYD